MFFSLLHAILETAVNQCTTATCPFMYLNFCLYPADLLYKYILTNAYFR